MVEDGEDQDGLQMTSYFFKMHNAQAKEEEIFYFYVLAFMLAPLRRPGDNANTRKLDRSYKWSAETFSARHFGFPLTMQCDQN